MTAAYLTADEVAQHRNETAASDLPGILSSCVSFARPSHTSSLRKKMPLVGQYLPNRLPVCNCPSASSNLCQSYFAVAGVSTAVKSDNYGKWWKISRFLSMRRGQPQYPSCSRSKRWCFCLEMFDLKKKSAADLNVTFCALCVLITLLLWLRACWTPGSQNSHLTQRK